MCYDTCVEVRKQFMEVSSLLLLKYGTRVYRFGGESPYLLTHVSNLNCMFRKWFSVPSVLVSHSRSG